MTVENSQNRRPETRASYPVVVAGAGPTGLVASLLLSQYRVAHLLVDERAEPDDHPQAHFINCRSMEILRELDGLDREVYALSPPPEDWGRFVYCTNLFDLPEADAIDSAPAGSLLGMVDHLRPVPATGHSPARATHYPQHDFVRLLRTRVRKSRYARLLEHHRVQIQETPKAVAVTLIDCRTGRRKKVQARYLVGADGAHSTIRRRLGIALTGKNGPLQYLINAHFFSPQLSEWIRARIPAMLYFIYSRFGAAVIVVHNLRRGEFVAQIPYFPPYQSASDFDKHRCTKFLQKLVGKPVAVEIRSVRTWRMAAAVASQFRSTEGRCFLIGDAAHQMTPAGGFGMNTGIQDAHNLMWKIAAALRREDSGGSRFARRLLRSYEIERQPVAQLNAKISVQNYRTTLQVPRRIGLDLRYADGLRRWLDRMPGSQRTKRFLFQSAMSMGLKQVDWLQNHHPLARRRRRALESIFADARRQTLQLLFPGQDLGFGYHKGWLAGRADPDAGRFDPFVFEPKLVVGGRMPHFWLIDAHGRRVSVLDLPSQMAAAVRTPCFVMLLCGDEKKLLAGFDDNAKQAFQPMVIVRVAGQSVPRGNRRYTFDSPRPSFLPRHFAALLRPDGHVAWQHLVR